MHQLQWTSVIINTSVKSDSNLGKKNYISFSLHLSLRLAAKYGCDMLARK